MIWLLEDMRDERELLEESRGIETVMKNEVVIVHNSSCRDEASFAVQVGVDSTGEVVHVAQVFFDGIVHTVHAVHDCLIHRLVQVIRKVVHIVRSDVVQATDG